MYFCGRARYLKDSHTLQSAVLTVSLDNYTPNKQTLVTKRFCLKYKMATVQYGTHKWFHWRSRRERLAAYVFSCCIDTMGDWP